MSTLKVDGQTIVVDPSNLPEANPYAKGAIRQGDGVAIRQEWGNESAKQSNEIIESLRYSGGLQNNKFSVIYNPNFAGDVVSPVIEDSNIYSANETGYIKFVNDDGEAPSKSGYIFLGWDTDPNVSIPEYSYDEYQHGTSYNYTFIDSDLILYAIWARVSHTINYYYGEYGEGALPSPQSAPEGTIVPLNFVDHPSVNDGSGREFVGWATSDGQTTAEYTSYGQNAVYLFYNLDLYPVFAYTVKYELGQYATGNVPTMQYGQYGSTIDLIFPTDIYPNSGSKVFCGWATVDGYGTYSMAEYTEDAVSEIYLTENVTLYPVFSMQYRAIYTLGNDGSGSVPSPSYGFEGQTIQLAFSPYPSCISDPSKSFIGWSTTDESSTADFTESGTDYTTLNNDLVLYPVFGSQPIGGGSIYINNQYGGGTVAIMDINEQEELATVASGQNGSYQFTAGEGYRIRVISGMSSTLSGTYKGASYYLHSLGTDSHDGYEWVEDPDNSMSWYPASGDDFTITVTGE